MKCYYDADVDRFFVSAFRLPLDPATAAFPEDESHVVLAVSASGDPTGAWNVWDLDTTDGDGSVANHTHCPCLADQPLIGADHFGFYISTNEYSLVPFGGSFNGAQVYAFNKAALAAGAGGSLTGVHIDNIPLAEGRCLHDPAGDDAARRHIRAVPGRDGVLPVGARLRRDDGRPDRGLGADRDEHARLDQPGRADEQGP